MRGSVAVELPGSVEVAVRFVEDLVLVWEASVNVEYAVRFGR